jgi:hypothetical protein
MHNIRIMRNTIQQITNSPRMPNNNKKIIITGILALGIIIVKQPPTINEICPRFF